MRRLSVVESPREVRRALLRAGKVRAVRPVRTSGEGRGSAIATSGTGLRATKAGTGRAGTASARPESGSREIRRLYSDDKPEGEGWQPE